MYVNGFEFASSNVPSQGSAEFPSLGTFVTRSIGLLFLRFILPSDAAISAILLLLCPL